jgi:hypothetical protein
MGQGSMMKRTKDRGRGTEDGGEPERTTLSSSDDEDSILRGDVSPAPSWCGHNSLVTSARGGWVQ